MQLKIPFQDNSQNVQIDQEILKLYMLANTAKPSENNVDFQTGTQMTFSERIKKAQIDKTHQVDRSKGHQSAVSVSSMS